MENLIGRKLEGRYLIESLVGVGGMANVYRGQDTRTGEPVAVKVLKEEFLDNEELVRRFKNESKAISILDHPNIVRVYDISVTDKLQYIVMEYIDGITLKEYLKQRGGVLTWKEVVHFATQVLSALEHAHGKGIVHRDVKPQNIMLLADGSIKMMDFGIARFSRAQSQTVSDKAIGSVHYISPEQAKGDHTDARTDIYSVGVMLYEMLAGILPFDGTGAVSIAIKQISDTARPLAEVAPEVPEGLRQITEKAMEKDPARRYQSAREMLDALAAFKRDPSIRFEYEYNTQSNPDKTINRVVSDAKATRADAASKTGKTGKKGKNVKKRRRKKRYHFPIFPIFAGMAVAFVIGAGLLVYLIFSNSSNALFSNRDDVEVINFVGMTRDEFLASDYNQKLSPVWVYEYDTTSTYASGVIFQQSPRSGRVVKEGQKITLRVSMGTQWIDIPDTRSYTGEAAKEMLTGLGLMVVTNRVDDDSVAAGTVAYSEPAAGTTVAGGSTVVLYVSREKVNITRTVPSVVGMLVDTARANISRNNLMPVVEEVPDASPAGTVLSQSPVGGTSVRMGSSVLLQVSSGVPEVIPEPEPQPTAEPTQTPTPEPTPCPHNYQEVSRTEPTCGANGSVTRQCTLCGDTVTETLPATGAHSFDSSQPYCLNGCGTPNPGYVDPNAGQPAA